MTGNISGSLRGRNVSRREGRNFALTDVSDGTLAGVPIESVRSPGELSTTSMARFGLARSRGELPLGPIRHPEPVRIELDTGS